VCVCGYRSRGVVGRAFASRLPFLLAVALVAAGLGDPVVESVANTGIFGGHFADNDHLAVLPTLFAGLIIALEILAVRFLEVWRSADGPGDRLIGVAKDIGARSFAREFPLIFGLQLISLFGLESVEQLFAGGKLLGGTAWLGGPVFFSLMVHAIIGAICTFALGACMRAMVRTFASIVRTAVRFIWLAIAKTTGGTFHLNRRAALHARAQAPHVRQIGGRAPPLLHEVRLSYIS